MTNPRINDNSGTLFDYIMKKHKLKRDVELAALIETTRSTVSEIRNGHAKIGNTLLVRIVERAGVSLKTAKAMIADR